ncbi:hypothetical protein ACLOJK_027961 [Asimina triloba]
MLYRDQQRNATGSVRKRSMLYYAYAAVETKTSRDTRVRLARVFSFSSSLLEQIPLHHFTHISKSWQRH